jgi:hypothetical protein
VLALARSAAEPPLTPSACRAGRALLGDSRRARGTYDGSRLLGRLRKNGLFQIWRNEEIGYEPSALPLVLQVLTDNMADTTGFEPAISSVTSSRGRPDSPTCPRHNLVAASGAGPDVLGL